VRFYTENGCFAFFSAHLVGLRATYDDHLRLVVVDSLLVLIELLIAKCMAVTAEALRANID